MTDEQLKYLMEQFEILHGRLCGIEVFQRNMARLLDKMAVIVGVQNEDSPRDALTKELLNHSSHPQKNC